MTTGADLWYPIEVVEKQKNLTTWKKIKKFLTDGFKYDKVLKLSQITTNDNENESFQKSKTFRSNCLQRKQKLRKNKKSSWQAQKRYDKISKLSKTTGTLITEQWNTWIENSFTFISNKTNGSKRTKTVKGISYWTLFNKPELAKVNSVPGTNTLSESLILAQDERWRRA